MEILGHNFEGPYEIDSKKLPSVHGVYILLDSSERHFKPIYIGKARNVKRRIVELHRNSKVMEVADQVYICPFGIENDKEALDFEMLLHGEYKPERNLYINNKIGSIKTFIEHIEKLSIEKPSEYLYFFRGHSDYKGYKLEPSIFRNENWISNEHKMFREIIIKCPNEFSKNMSTFEKLVKMQHYSLPTRLLDITENPLVALYFACNGNLDKDGEVIIFRVPKDEVKYYDSDTVSVISNISKRPSDFDISNISGLEVDDFNKEDAISYLLHEIKEEKPYFSAKINPNHLESVVCVKPKLDNPRVIRQDGAFLVYGMNGNKKQQAKIKSDYLVTSESIKLVINKAGKGRLKQQLASLGISDATMFPEIDNVSQHLKSNF